MRLISCYIENFGKLNRFAYDFAEGINVICESNGWGKTTLAAFLKAMFYGMEHSTKRNVDDNEYKKYQPWNGGAYGGNLIFETDGKKYRVERFFGLKDKEDTFVFYDEQTGLKSDAYTENLGEELFGIDRVAFEQSIFLKQGMYGISMTDSVATKMSGLMASGDDIDCYKVACDRLETEMRIYKKTGNKGKIAELTEEINELGHRIAEAKQTGETLKDWQNKARDYSAEINECRKRKEGLKEQIRKAGELAALQEKHKHYLAILAEKEKLGQKVEELDYFFRNGLPEEEELEEYRNKFFDYRSESQKQEAICQSYKYPQLVKVLSENPMSEESVEACERKWDVIRKNERLLDEKEAQLQKLQLNDVEKKAEQKADTERYRRQMTGCLIVAVIAVVCIIIAVVLQKWLYAVPAVIILIVSIAVFILKQKQMKKNNIEDNAKLVQTEAEYKELQKSVESAKKALLMYLQDFHPESVEEIPTLLNRIRITIMETDAEEKRRRQHREAETQIAEEKAHLREEIILFLRKYYGEVTEAEEYLLKEIAGKRNDYINLSKQYEEKCMQLSQTEKGEEVAPEQLIPIETLQQQEKTVEQEIVLKEEYLRQVKSTILKYTQVMEDCEKWEMEKQDMEEVLGEYKSKYNLLEKTLKYLQTAQTEFSSRYLKKINEGYHKYARLINEESLNHSDMDLKLAIKTEEGGARRDVAYFSRGTREAMELCSRFALVDALFEKETPFVILDDPFANFDEKTIAGGMHVLEQIAEQYQIIYFTCHLSRK